MDASKGMEAKQRFVPSINYYNQWIILDIVDIESSCK